MSFTKRILFENDPAFDDVRGRIKDTNRQYVDQFQHRTAMRRRNRRGHGPLWDPLWRRSLEMAVTALGIEVVRVNEGMFFRTAEERDAALAYAETEWQKVVAR